MPSATHLIRKTNTYLYFILGKLEGLFHSFRLQVTRTLGQQQLRHGGAVGGVFESSFRSR